MISTEVLKHAVCLLLPTLISSACSYTKKEKENENENYNRNAVIKRKSSQNKFIHFHLKWEKTCFFCNVPSNLNQVIWALKAISLSH